MAPPTSPAVLSAVFVYISFATFSSFHGVRRRVNFWLQASLRNVTKCKPIGNEICDLTRFLLFKGWIWSGEDTLSKWFGNYSLLYICFIDSTRLQKWRYFRNRAKSWECQKSIYFKFFLNSTMNRGLGVYLSKSSLIPIF